MGFEHRTVSCLLCRSDLFDRVPSVYVLCDSTITKGCSDVCSSRAVCHFFVFGRSGSLTRFRPINQIEKELEMPREAIVDVLPDRSSIRWLHEIMYELQLSISGTFTCLAANLYGVDTVHHDS